MTLDELFVKANEMAADFKPDGPVPDAKILINIEGDDSRRWLASFADGKGRLAEYAGEPPDATVTTGADTLIAVATGKLNATMAFLTGKVIVDGDADLLGSLGRLWPKKGR
ncbi:MAG: SCP2 sterol-binding domain-containing protein [Deltaproteobacteria bacterium]|jgi:putative sterol carrier protein|nr:SCP2 sterol-binding domain-containing protein [Deltaproteobacteria bacterium]